MGVDVYGVSLDDVADLAAFAEAQSLELRLLSDPDGSAAAKYGVLHPDRPFANRVTFVLDERGVLRHVDREVKVDTHGDDLIEVLDGLRSD